MDVLLDFLVRGFTFFGITFQYRMLAFATIFVLWALYSHLNTGSDHCSILIYLPTRTKGLAKSLATHLP
jgi:hypothetical protein